jgi:hypothetical protein
MAIAELNGREIQKGPNHECLGPRKCLGLQYTDMTIHWKALVEHFLMVPFAFQFIFRGEMHFLNFYQKS